jgi:hypothetical protein
MTRPAHSQKMGLAARLRRIGRLGYAPGLVELPILKSLPVSLLPPPAQLCLVIERYRIEIGKGFDSEDLERVVRMLGRI